MHQHRVCHMANAAYAAQLGRKATVVLLALLARGARGTADHDLIAAFQAGDQAEAERLQAISAEACLVLAGSGGFGSALKAILKTMGLDLGGMRRPQVNLAQEKIAEIQGALEKLGALEYLNR